MVGLWRKQPTGRLVSGNFISDSNVAQIARNEFFGLIRRGPGYTWSERPERYTAEERPDRYDWKDDGR